MYARTAQYIKSRKDLTEDMSEGSEEIVMDSAKAKAIYDASKSSMGRWTHLTGIIYKRYIHSRKSAQDKQYDRKLLVNRCCMINIIISYTCNYI